MTTTNVVGIIITNVVKAVYMEKYSAIREMYHGRRGDGQLIQSSEEYRQRASELVEIVEKLKEKLKSSTKVRDKRLSFKGTKTLQFLSLTILSLLNQLLLRYLLHTTLNE